MSTTKGLFNPFPPTMTLLSVHVLNSYMASLQIVAQIPLEESVLLRILGDSGDCAMIEIISVTVLS